MFKKVLATLTALTLAVATLASVTSVSAAGIGDDFDGWRYIWQGAPEGGENNPHTWYRNSEGGAMFFNCLNVSDIHQLLLNTDVAGISNENTEKFGKDNMNNFTIEFDMNVTGIGLLGGEPNGHFSISFCGARGDHLNDHSLKLYMNNSCSAMWVEGAGDGSTTFAGSNLNNILLANGPHHISIQKQDRRVIVIVDNNTKDPFFDVTVPESQGSWTIPNSGYIGFNAWNTQGWIANVKVTNDTTSYSKTFFEDYCKEWAWSMGGKNKDDGMAMLPSYSANGSGIYGKSVGEIDDSHTTTQYLNLLDLKDFTFEFTPKTIAATDNDANAWMGFALTNKDKDFSIGNANKGTGFVAEIYTAADGKAKMVFKSLLEDEEYGAHSVTVEDLELKAGTTYKLNIKDTDNGTEIYSVSAKGEATKLATLDWLKGNFTQHKGYFTFTGSVTKNDLAMEWVVNTMNGEAAAGYLSDAEITEEEPTDTPVDGGTTNPPVDGGTTNPPADDNKTDAPSKDDNKVIETGVSSVAFVGALIVLLLSGAMLTVMKKKAE